VISRLSNVLGRTAARWLSSSSRRIEEAARSVLTVLRVRGLRVPDAVRERILAEQDPERLERWLEKAAVATSTTALLDEPN
jgi:post-segregation antitoxin (ccd killing protein)